MKRDFFQVKNWNRTVYVRLFKRLLLLVIPLALLFTAYIGLNYKIKEQARERILETLKDGIQKIEMTFDSLDQISFYLNDNADITQYLRASKATIANRTTDVLKAQKVLTPIRISNTDILNIQVYSGQSDTLIDYFTNVLYLERYYGAGFRLEGMDEALFREAMLGEENNSAYRMGAMTLQNSEYDTLVYNCRLNGLGRWYNNRILFYVSQDRLRQLLAPMEYDKGCFLCLTGGDGQYLIYDNERNYDIDGIDGFDLEGSSGYKEIRVGKEKMLLAWHRSETRGWLCVELIPVSSVLAVTQNFRILMLCLLVVSLAAGGALIFLMARRLSAPIIELGNVLDKDGKLPVEDFVEEVKKLVAYNTELDEKMQLQTSVLKTGAFYRLLTGEVLDEKSVEEVVDKIGITRQAACYAVLLVSCNDIGAETKLDEISAQKVFLEKLIREQKYEEVMEIYHIDFERMVILMASGDLSARQIRERAEKLISDVLGVIGKTYYYSVSVGGDVIGDIRHLPEAFVHTKKALNIPQNVFGFRRIQWYEQVRQYQAMEKYELSDREDSISLQNRVLMDKVKEYIQENYSNPQLSLSMLAEEMCMTEVYLSKLFKKATGENFSKYVENCRMKKAKELIDQGRKVKEAAELTGYNSPQVFRRAWKRYYDHVPSEARTEGEENL